MHNAPPHLSEAVAQVTGRKVTSARLVVGRGYTPASRFVVLFEDDTTAFIKWATDAGTARHLALEIHNYENLPAAPWRPAFYGAGVATDETGQPQPFLLLEDLSHCDWPPPWSADTVAAVTRTLAQVAATRGPWLDSLPRIDERKPIVNFWEEVAGDPAAFLSLQLCSARWLDAALPVLLAASASPPLSGDDLLHNDVRSDNLCFRPDGCACLIDWNKACRGNALFDVAMWLPSLAAESGSLPEAVSPAASRFSPWLAGYFAARTPLQNDPRLRQMLDDMLPPALNWACRTLNLPPLQ